MKEEIKEKLDSSGFQCLSGENTNVKNAINKLAQDYYKDLEQKQELKRKLEKALREKDDDELYKQMFELFGYEAPKKEDIKKK